MQIFDSKNNLISSFDVFDDAYIEKNQNKLDILSFSVPKSLGFKIKEEGYVEIPEGRFVVKEKKKSGNYYDIVCKPDIEIFELDYVPNYTYTTQSFKSIMDQVLTGSGWTCVCTETGNKTLSGKQKTKWEIIQHAIELFGYEVKYDIKNKIIYAGKLLGNDRGAFFHHEVNLRELNVSSDTYDFCTKLIPIGKDDLTIEEINGGLNYVLPDVPVEGKTITKVWIDSRYTVKENLMAAAKEKVNAFSKPYRSYEADVIDLARLKPTEYSYLQYDVGDIITLVDKENETYENQRIVSKKEYLRDRLKDTVTIANRPKSISETSIQALNESIKVNKQYIDVLDGEIKSKVSLEEYNVEMDDVTSRLSSAEQKITPDAIVSTVTTSTQYAQDINDSVTNKLADPAVQEQFKQVVFSSTPPSNIEMLWYDVDNKTLKVYNGTVWVASDAAMQAEVAAVREESTALVNQTADSIRSEVATNYYAKDETDTLLSSVSSEVTQLGNKVQIDINSLSTTVDQNKSEIDSQLETITRSFFIDAAGAHVKKSGAPTEALVDETGYHILDNGVKVASFANGEVLNKKMVIEDTLTVNGWRWEVDDKGNFNLIKI